MRFELFMARRYLRGRGKRIISGGTDTHLLLADVFAKGIRGKDAQTLLQASNIGVHDLFRETLVVQIIAATV